MWKKKFFHSDSDYSFNILSHVGFKKTFLYSNSNLSSNWHLSLLSVGKMFFEGEGESFNLSSRIIILYAFMNSHRKDSEKLKGDVHKSYGMIDVITFLMRR